MGRPPRPSCRPVCQGGRTTTLTWAALPGHRVDRSAKEDARQPLHGPPSPAIVSTGLPRRTHDNPYKGRPPRPSCPPVCQGGRTTTLTRAALPGHRVHRSAKEDARQPLHGPPSPAIVSTGLPRRTHDNPYMGRPPRPSCRPVCQGGRTTTLTWAALPGHRVDRSAKEDARQPLHGPPSPAIVSTGLPRRTHDNPYMGRPPRPSCRPVCQGGCTTTLTRAALPGHRVHRSAKEDARQPLLGPPSPAIVSTGLPRRTHDNPY